MKATIYNPNTGEILRTVSAGRVEDFELNIGSDEMWIEGVYSPFEYYIKDQTACLMPDRPDYPCYFDTQIGQWLWDEAASWSVFRRERNRRLAACDWTQVPDAPVDQAAWAAYRQQLRDLPFNTSDPRNPIWPEQP